MEKFMTPEQVYANLLQEKAQVEEILKGNPNDGKVGVILLNKERLMTALITEDGCIGEAFNSLAPQHLTEDEAWLLRKYYKDVHGEVIKMEAVSDLEYYTLLLKKMNNAVKAFQNVYGF